MAAPRPAPRANTATWVGLFVSLFSMIIIRQVFLPFGANQSVRLTVWKEVFNFASAGLLLWLVKTREKRPLNSVGFGVFAIPGPCHEAKDKTESMSYPWLRHCPDGILHIPQQALQPRFSHKAADDAQK